MPRPDLALFRKEYARLKRERLANDAAGGRLRVRLRRKEIRLLWASAKDEGRTGIRPPRRPTENILSKWKQYPLVQAQDPDLGLRFWFKILARRWRNLSDFGPHPRAKKEPTSKA